MDVVRAGGVRQGGGGHGAQEKVHFCVGRGLCREKVWANILQLHLLLNKHHIKVNLFQSYLLKSK